MHNRAGSLKIRLVYILFCHILFLTSDNCHNICVAVLENVLNLLLMRLKELILNDVKLKTQNSEESVFD